MANVSKYTKAAMGQLCQHYERKKGADGAYIKFGNQDIDLERTEGNYNLAPHREGGQISYIHKRLSEIKCLNRADVKVMCSWVVTLPKVFPIDREREFFERIYRFLENKYGTENVISAYIHKDENQPHMHFAFIPVTIGKDGKEKVSAKEVLTKAELQRFHRDLHNELEKCFGFDVGILNGATQGGNRTVQELKAQRAAAQHQHKIDALQSEVDAAQEALALATESVVSFEKEKAAVEKQLHQLEKRMLTKHEVMELKGKKNLFGGLKNVSYDDFDALKRTAKQVDSMRSERDAALAKVEAARKRVIAAEAATKEALGKSPSIELQLKHNKTVLQYRRMIKRLQSMSQRLPDPFQKMIHSILADRDPVVLSRKFRTLGNRDGRVGS